MPAPKLSANNPRAEIVAATLENYAERGVFRGFSKNVQSANASFRLLWHRDRTFELQFEPKQNALRIAQVIPNVNAAMYRDLQSFINTRRAPELPDHRRIDPSKTQIIPARRGGNVALTAQILDGDDDYAARKLIHLVHEIFLTFLMEGKYYEYMVENFDLDPDRM